MKHLKTFENSEESNMDKKWKAFTGLPSNKAEYDSWDKIWLVMNKDSHSYEAIVIEAAYKSEEEAEKARVQYAKLQGVDPDSDEYFVYGIPIKK